MKRILLSTLSLLIFIIGCSTFHSRTLSYQTKVDKASSERAWSRAHAYFLIHYGIIRSNQYFIQAEDVRLTREFENNHVKIRIFKKIFYATDVLGEDRYEIWKMRIAKSGLLGALKYIKSGVSPLMRDGDLPKIKGNTIIEHRRKRKGKSKGNDSRYLQL